MILIKLNCSITALFYFVLKRCVFELRLTHVILPAHKIKLGYLLRHDPHKIHIGSILEYSE